MELYKYFKIISRNRATEGKKKSQLQALLHSQQFIGMKKGQNLDRKTGRKKKQMNSYSRDKISYNCSNDATPQLQVSRVWQMFI